MLIQCKWIFIVLSLFSCEPTKMNNDCKKCSVEIAIKASDVSNINEVLIKELFCTGRKNCEANVEFMETYNEALFLCLQSKPDIFVQQLSQISNQAFILEQLKTPINDKIVPKQIIDKLLHSTAKRNDSYNKILTALRIAEKKQ